MFINTCSADFKDISKFYLTNFNRNYINDNLLSYIIIKKNWNNYILDNKLKDFLKKNKFQISIYLNIYMKNNFQRDLKLYYRKYYIYDNIMFFGNYEKKYFTNHYHENYIKIKLLNYFYYIIYKYIILFLFNNGIDIYDINYKYLLNYKSEKTIKVINYILIKKSLKFNNDFVDKIKLIIGNWWSLWSIDLINYNKIHNIIYNGDITKIGIFSYNYNYINWYKNKLNNIFTKQQILLLYGGLLGLFDIKKYGLIKENIYLLKYKYENLITLNRNNNFFLPLKLNSLIYDDKNFLLNNKWNERTMEKIIKLMNLSYDEDYNYEYVLSLPEHSNREFLNYMIDNLKNLDIRDNINENKIKFYNIIGQNNIINNIFKDYYLNYYNYEIYNDQENCFYLYKSISEFLLILVLDIELNIQILTYWYMISSNICNNSLDTSYIIINKQLYGFEIGDILLYTNIIGNLDDEFYSSFCETTEKNILDIFKIHNIIINFIKIKELNYCYIIHIKGENILKFKNLITPYLLNFFK